MNPVAPVLATSIFDPALITFTAYTLAVFGLAAVSNRLLKKKSFLSEYFLGSRSLGVWAFALTFAATSSSGGSFTGFPSKIYSHGWILALWIGSYMVVPICTMGLIGKRINQIARISGAITVPDVVRDRFQSVAFGLLATTLIVFFMSFNLVAQFKAGSLILRTLLEDVTLFQDVTSLLAARTMSVGFLENVEAEYLVCLLTFGVAVIIYTTYGGFHAVVWTDVMQGIVMVLGVLVMLPLTLYAVGGLETATQQIAEMTPPQPGTATLVPGPTAADSASADSASADSASGTAGTGSSAIPSATSSAMRITPQRMSTTAPEEVRDGDWVTNGQSGEQLRLFRITQTIPWPNGSQQLADVPVLEITTPGEITRIHAREFADGTAPTVRVASASTRSLAFPPEEQQGSYVSGPGPSLTQADGFLPLSLAISFFFMWAISGTGQPSNMVRLMAFNSAQTLRRSIFTVAFYYSLIYFPLVIIFCCARVLLPGMDAESDRIMPQMAVFLTENVGMGWLAGLLVAAPFAAVMSTVDSFLLMISSALVRDVYQRNINPDAPERNIKRLSYLVTMLVGTCALLGAINPPRFLQDIIVYTGSGLAACFLAPMVAGLYWRRVNTAGAMGGMLAGFSAHLSMYVAGIFSNGSFFQPYRLLNFDPIIVGLVVSFSTVLLVTLITRPPDAELVRRYFYRRKQ